MKALIPSLLLVAAALAGPAAAQAPSTLPLVGYLGAESTRVFEERLAWFRKGLAETGFEEGRNVVVEYRWAESDNKRLPALAAELAARKPVVIVAPGSLASALAAKAATSTIPVVFETGADPMIAGLVDSLNRPSGNVTGISSLNSAVLGKRIERLHALVPKARKLGLLVNPTNPVNAQVSTREAAEAAARLGLELRIFAATREEEFDAAFASFVAERMDMVAIANETLFNRPAALARLAVKHAIPVAHQSPEFARAGGLMSYGGDVAESHRLAGVYVGRVLKGERVANLPVQQVTRIVSAVNARAARTLGLAVPPHVMAATDDVFE
jgi:putative tryptophan/tyrosine transport system substrate-binding protein